MRMHKLAMVVIGLVAAAGFAACASEEPPIDRVQPNALSKSMFDGEWYLHRTVIDTPYSAGTTFVGEGFAMSKIKWSIEENFLIARRTYQLQAGAENGGVAGAGVNRTAPVAMYAIQSHFDIRRQYNPSTGEETNVIEENAIDRPWNEREYMRVDWSKNLISEPDNSLTGALAAVELDPVNFYVNDPSHPWAPRFEADENGDVTYMDIVNKYFAQPDMVTAQYSDGTLVQVPRCYLISDAHLDCQPSEIAVRSSYMKVPDRDYEPLEYTADRMTRFGYFLTMRDGYDPNYGITANNRFRFANRHNIWQQSHARDKDGKFISCVENAACPGDGSYCDVTIARAKRESSGKCTIPFREREIRPIAYYLSEGFPEDLEPDAQAMADEWNSALQATVGSLRAIECQENDGGNCEALRQVDEDVFVLCHNPVERGDDPACGKAGKVVQVGDVRYNMLAWVSEPHLGSPLGYGPSFPDPETGEVISAMAYIYGAAMETVTAYGRDLVALLNEDLTEERLTDNNQFGNWIRDPSPETLELAAAIKNPAFAQQTPEWMNRHAVDVGADDVASIDGAMTLDWMRDLARIKRGAGDVPRAEDLLARVDAARTRIIDAVGELRIGDQGRARLAALRDTKFERLMIDDESVIAAGYAPGTALTDDVIEKASPLRGMSIEAMRAREDLRRQVQNPRNGCILTASFADDGILGLAREISRAAKDGKSVRWHGVDYSVGSGGKIDYVAVNQMLRHPIFHAVAAHEVGHTLGLRHNFVGSFDSANYHDQYWKLRMASNQPSATCKSGVCSRLYDPMTQAEIDGRIREYQYSTVMDYPNNSIVGDAHGIGKYDRAAIKMGYGDLVEVFSSVPTANQELVAQIGALNDFGWPAPLDVSALDRNVVRVIPYTEFPEIVGGLESLRAREDVRFGALVDGTGTFEAGVPTSTADGRPTVPYRYCGDEFSDFSPECLRYDAGADVYETVMSQIDTYWNYYIFNNFMRQRLGFDPDAIQSRVYSRYFSKLEGANTYYTLFRGIMEDIGANDFFFQAEDGFGPFTAAVGGAYELFGKVIGTPEPGNYTNIGGVYENSGSSGTSGFGGGGLVIDTFDGRRLRTGYDFGPDSSFFFLTRAGFFNDKALALQMLTYSDVRVIGQDTTSDIRRYQISYYTTFQDATSSVFRAAIGNDWDTFAPRAVSGGKLVYPDVTHHLTRDGMAGDVVDPNFGFTLEFYAMVYGMAFMPRTFDQDFVDQARIFVQGGAESVQLDASIDTVRFVDEDSGLVYLAPKYPDASGNETGVGAQVLMHALELQKAAVNDATKKAELDAWMDNVNILRELTWQTGFGAPYQYQP